MVPGKRIAQRPHPPPCDNSNDSGLGFDKHTELRCGLLSVPSGANISSSASSNSTTDNGQGASLVVNSTLTNPDAVAAAAAAAAAASNTLQQHHQQQQQQQQHLIRAIPVSRWVY